MLACWQHSAADRPTFQETTLYLEELLNPSTSPDHTTIDANYIRFSKLNPTENSDIYRKTYAEVQDDYLVIVSSSFDDGYLTTADT